MSPARARRAEAEPATAHILVVFDLDQRRHAVNLAAIERVARLVDITPLPNAPAIVAGVIDVQGRVIPVVNIRERLGLPERALSLDDRLIVIRTAHRTVAFVADAVRGVVSAPGEAMAAAQTILAGTKNLDGVLKLNDGLVVIHDLTRFLSLEEETQLEASLRGLDEHRTQPA